MESSDRQSAVIGNLLRSFAYICLFITSFTRFYLLKLVLVYSSPYANVNRVLSISSLTSVCYSVQPYRVGAR